MNEEWTIQRRVCNTTTHSSESVRDCCLTTIGLAFLHSYIMAKTGRWDNDDVCYVLDQHA
jgi:hypothetical protein